MCFQTNYIYLQPYSTLGKVINYTKLYVINVKQDETILNLKIDI